MLIRIHDPDQSNVITKTFQTLTREFRSDCADTNNSDFDHEK
jgi:hypothetical protein